MPLQRVSLGQVRFNLPGLAVDSRGVVAGRQLAARFGALDRLVSFLRILSAGQSLDDVHGSLRILYARPEGGPRETVVILGNPSQGFADAVAQAARTAGGQCFTGSGRHFAQFRDARSPLGYDADALVQGAGDFILYGADHAAPYAIESELSLQKLLLRLSLRRRHGEDDPARDLLYVSARRGLGATVAEYLHHARVPAAAALCETGAESAFRPGSGFWLFRLSAVPERMIGLLGGTPGLELYAPVAPNVSVAVGHRHPIHLDACKSVFPADHFYLFSPSVAGATVVSPAPTFVSVDDLVKIPSPAPQDPEAAATRTAQLRGLNVPLRLEAAPGGSRRAVATLVPWSQAPWLKRLCYALPGTALRGYRVALLERGILLVSPSVLDGFPFGALLDLAAPGVLVPLGTRLRPAVSPELLASRVGATGGALVVFPRRGEDPFRVPADQIEPLERRTLSAVQVDTDPGQKDAKPAPAGEPAPIEVRNEGLGPMPLWGVRR